MIFAELSDPARLIGYPSFFLILYLGVNMMRRQRDTDRRQQRLIAEHKEMYAESIRIALDREEAAQGRLEEVMRAYEQMRRDVMGRSDERGPE